MPAQFAKVYSKIILRELKCVFMHMLLYFVFVYCFVFFLCFFFFFSEKRKRPEGWLLESNSPCKRQIH